MVKDVLRSLSQISNLEDAHAWAPNLTRGIQGLIVRPACRKSPPRPEAPLELFDFEACPYCRKVREVLTELDLSYVVRTCAKGAETNRAQVEALGGKRMFPYLVDPNTGTKMYESEDIITYLVETYGGGARPALGRALSPLNTGAAMAASLLRRRGGRVRPGLEHRKQPEQLLVLYNMEASPWCRKVREALNELNLDYQVESVGKGSRRRPELRDRGGKVQVPYLVDPNTGTEMYESSEIVAYLERTYGDTAADTATPRATAAAD